MTTPTLSPSELREIEGRAVALWRVPGTVYVWTPFPEDASVPGPPNPPRPNGRVEGRWLPLADHALLCSALRAAWAEIARLGGEG